jgi:hypothetical protein
MHTRTSPDSDVAAAAAAAAFPRFRLLDVVTVAVGSAMPLVVALKGISSSSAPPSDSSSSHCCTAASRSCSAAPDASNLPALVLFLRWFWK